MRRLEIIAITPSTTPGVPSYIEVGLNFTSLFHGKEWIDGAGARFPFYAYDYDTLTAAPEPPAGTSLLVATTFDIVENTKYAGRYTVYTTPLGGLASSEYLSGPGRTRIRVNEAMPAGVGAELTDGFITHISTYLLDITGESSLLVLEKANLTDRPIELVGKHTSGWGEVMEQNLLRLTQCFAGPSSPTNPYLGQLWYDTLGAALMIRTTGGWEVVNSGTVGGAPYRHTQSVASTTWVIPHGLVLPSPFHACADFFINTVGGVKAVLPFDITYNNANQLTATFTSAETGYAVVRS